MENKLIEGRMISASKSGYMKRHPDNLVLFNANVFDEDNKKIWWGDLDITEGISELVKIAAIENKTIFILSEMDGSFEREFAPRMKNFVLKINTEGEYELGDYYKEYYNLKTLKRK